MKIAKVVKNAKVTTFDQQHINKRLTTHFKTKIVTSRSLVILGGIS